MLTGCLTLVFLRMIPLVLLRKPFGPLASNDSGRKRSSLIAKALTKRSTL